MPRRSRIPLSVLLAVAASSIPAASAPGDGLPLPVDGTEGAGVTSRDGQARYSAVTSGGRTVLMRIDPDGGEIEATELVRGTFGVPLVAYDASPGGLSHDGETLVLIEPRRSFPRAETKFAVVDPQRLRLRRRLVLEGDFSFDALSADGRLLYLIEYLDPRDPTAYEVRAYDLERERLLSEPIVDPNESSEEMAGWPQTRAVSPDGRWAYTLYARVGREPPFIHALDTERRTAVCIDLDSLRDHPRVDRLELAPAADGGELSVLDRDEALASVDLASFEVSEPPQAAEAVGEQRAEGAGGDPLPWLALGAGILLTVLAIVGLGRRRDRASATAPAAVDARVTERDLDRLLADDAERESEAVR